MGHEQGDEHGDTFAYPRFNRSSPGTRACDDDASTFKFAEILQLRARMGHELGDDHGAHVPVPRDSTTLNWDTSSVTTMEHTFNQAYKFNQPGISAWDVSKVSATACRFHHGGNAVSCMGSARRHGDRLGRLQQAGGIAAERRRRIPECVWAGQELLLYAYENMFYGAAYGPSSDWSTAVCTCGNLCRGNPCSHYSAPMLALNSSAAPTAPAAAATSPRRP